MDTAFIPGAIPPVISSIIAAVSFVAGGLITYYIYRILLKKKRLNMINEAELEAEVIKKEKILQAKEKFYQLKSEHEKLINEKNNKINQTENKIKQRELALSQRIAESQKEKQEIEAIRENLKAQLELVEKKSEEMEKLHKHQVDKLESISGLSGEEAKMQLVESMKEEAKTEAMSYINEIMGEAKMTATKEAKK